MASVGRGMTTFGQRGVGETRPAVRLQPAGPPAQGAVSFFLFLVPPAFLAAVLVKLSSIAAPILHLEYFFWMATFCYCYFMLGRATFLVASDAVPGTERPDRVFHRAFRLVALRPMIKLMFIALALDLVTSRFAVAPKDTGVHMMLIGILVWITCGPLVLLACGLAASDGELSLARAKTAFRDHIAPVLGTWALVGLIVGGLYGLLMGALYPVMRSVAIRELYLDGKGIFWYSACFQSVVIALAVWTQAELGAWLAGHIRRRERAKPVAPRAPLTPAPTVPTPIAEVRAGTLLTKPAVKVAKPPRTMSRMFVLRSRVMGGLMALYGLYSVGYEMAERVSAVLVPGTVARSVPMCEVRWTTKDLFNQNDVDHVRRLHCAWAPGLVDAVKDAKRVSTTEGVMLTVEYQIPETGLPRTFAEFVPARRQPPALRDAVDVDYVAWREWPARIALKYRPWPIGLLYVSLGLLVLSWPTVRHRIFGTRYDPPPLPKRGRKGPWQRK